LTKYKFANNVLYILPPDNSPGASARIGRVKIITNNKVTVEVGDVKMDLTRIVGAREQWCIHLMRGRELFLGFKYAEALHEFRTADLRMPSTDSLLGIGLCYLNMRNDENAYRVLDRFLEYYPLFVDRGVVYRIVLSIAKRLGRAKVNKIARERSML
jgi:hypothetical protein